MSYVGYSKRTFEMQTLKYCYNFSTEDTFLCLMDENISRICYKLSNTDLGFSVLPRISMPSTLRMVNENKSRT